MPDPAEIELIRKCREGDESAFRELVERYQRRTYWVAHNMLNSYELAQDICQEAFVRVFRNLGRFDTKKNFYTWLYQIVVNLCIDQMRKLSHGRAVDLEEIGGLPDPDERKDPVGSTERADLRRRVQRVLDRLPLKYKIVLTLRDIHGFSCEEIAEIAECTNATVRWRLHRARRLFKDLWGRTMDRSEEEASRGQAQEG
ncbi:MAG: sigma-70 family RNA polymerase sigma factor [Planctomycetes bacterium]|nr:sigma-70 family RNA polymerase sigma factor [Planctomycetota bacterium]